MNGAIKATDPMKHLRGRLASTIAEVNRLADNRFIWRRSERFVRGVYRVTARREMRELRR